MASDGQIVFEITADGKKAVASVQDVTRAIETETKKWDVSAGNASKNMESSFTAAIGKIGAAMGAAKIGQLLMDFGKQAIDTASDLREVQNVVDVTFGEGAAQIETWAKSAASNFGLTETQAKKFTSTLGAMMKSSGLAGDEIIGMSTDLSGLAADMASFYNLDFDTAFQKIRAGISGETEPLKQLGINMSVANLEAYALTQGITKSFDKMSQGEQIMLRYQYLMQATADAQGDFARTADGFANAQRRVETAISSIKTSVGTMLLDVVEPLTSGLAGFLEKLTAVPETTVIDEFNKIDANTEAKMAEITKTAGDAQDLIGVLKGLEEKEFKNESLQTWIENIATKSNILDGNSGDNWKKLLDTLNTADVTKGIFGTDASAKITSLSDALSSTDPTKKKAAWQEMLGVLSGNVDKISQLTGKSTEELSAWFSDLNSRVPEAGDDLNAWNALFTELVVGLDGLNGKVFSDTFLNSFSLAADDANKLNAQSGSNWKSLIDALNSADVTKGIFGSDASGKITALSEALASTDPTKKKAAWEEMLGVLTGNVDKISQLTGKSTEELSAWFTDLNSRVPKAGDDLTAWNALFTELVAGLDGLNGKVFGQDFLNSLSTAADDANKLNASSSSNWSSLLTALNDADVTKGVFGADAASRISGLSEALSGADPTKKKAAWQEMLGVLSSNADAVSKLTNKSPEELKQFFTELSEAAPETDEDLGKWNDLLTSLASAFTGLDKEGLGQNFIDSLEKLGTGVDGNAFFAALTAGFIGIGDEANDAEKSLKALGIDTSNVDDRQRLWLATCKELVKTIPGLAEIINAETGEIKGGIGALEDYVNEWKTQQEALVLWKAHFQKQEALAESSNIAGLQLSVGAAEQRLKRLHKELDSVVQAGIDAEKSVMNESTGIAVWTPEAMEAVEEASEAAETIRQAEKELEDARKSLKTTTDANAEAQQRLADEEEYLTETYGQEAKAAAEAANKTKDVAEATEQLTIDEKALQKELKGVTKALEEVEKYYDNAYKGIEKALEGSHELFGTVIDPAQKAKDKIAEVEKSISELTKKSDKDKKAKLQIELTGLKEAQKTITNMNTGLQSQITYYQKYLEMLNKAREMGYSDEVLSSVSDGSQASYEYLQAMTNTGISTEQVNQLNEGFKKVNEEREKLTKELTEQSLSTDKAFQNLVKSATDAVNGLNLGEEAKSAMEQTVQGLINGIAAKHKDLQTEVDAVSETLNRMGGFGFNFGFGAGGFSLSFGSKGKDGVDGSFATGLDYVPFNHFLAELHEGEGILTAEENKVWQNFKNGGLSTRNTVDYDALGATMRDNVKAGGNVYLDGQTVGRVISASQANAFRSMERSGFQQ